MPSGTFWFATKNFLIRGENFLIMGYSLKRTKRHPQKHYMNTLTPPVPGYGNLVGPNLFFPILYYIIL